MLSLALWGSKHLEATGGGKGPSGTGRGDPFLIPPAILALLCDPRCLTPTLPSWRHAIPSWAVGPTSAAPLSPHPHQVLQGREGHRAKASLELMTAQPFRCQCKIQESTRATRSRPPPPITAWCSAPSSPSLGEEPGATPSEEERELEKCLPKYRVPRDARGRWGGGA